MKTSYQQALALYEAWLRQGHPADRCQCCGAHINEGLKGCFELFAELPLRDYVQRAEGSASTYCVDAHALQHPEIHGKKNNAAHLLRLCWLFEHSGDARLGAGPAWWQRYLAGADVPALAPPTNRGRVTVADVAQAQTPDEHLEWSRRWATAVWQAWSAHHDWARNELQRVWKR